MTRTIALSIVAPVLLFSHAAAALDPSPVTVSPGSSEYPETIASECPTFSWGAMIGADSYELVVYEVPSTGDGLFTTSAAEGVETEDSPLLSRSLPGSALSWTPALRHCLDAGGSYAWAIRGLSESLRSEWSPAAFFEVAPKSLVEAQDETSAEDSEQIAAGSLAPATDLSASSEILVRRALRSELEGTLSPATASAAIHGELTATSGQTYGIIGLSHSPDGAGLGAENLAGGADLVLGDADAPASLTESGIDRASPVDRAFNIQNSGAGAMKLQVDGVDVLTAATGGDITAVTTGAGLTGGGTSGDLTLGVAAGGITGTELAAGSVAGGAAGVVLDGSLTADDLGPDSVASEEIAANAVGSSEIASDAVTSSEIAPGAVGSDEIATGAVGSDELADGSLTGADIQDGSIGIADLGFDPATQTELDAQATASSAAYVDAAGDTMFDDLTVQGDVIVEDDLVLLDELQLRSNMIVSNKAESVLRFTGGTDDFEIDLSKDVTLRADPVGGDFTIMGTDGGPDQSGISVTLVAGSGDGIGDGGSIILSPGDSTGMGAAGIVGVTGTRLILDSDNQGSGADVELVASQGTEPDGVLKYDAVSGSWQLSNGGGAFSPLLTEATGGDVTAVTAGTGLTGGGTSGELTVSVAVGGITSAEVANSSVLFEDLGQNGCSDGQIMKLSGSAWTCAVDQSGGTDGHDHLGENWFGSVDGSWGLRVNNQSMASGSIGIAGKSHSASGKAIVGEISNAVTAGLNFGVWGRSHSSAGIGVYGEVDNPIGQNYGVEGISNGNDGAGVRGENTFCKGGCPQSASPEDPIGVWGKTHAPWGRAVNGGARTPDGTGENYGVYGWTNSVDGFGGFFVNLNGGPLIAANNEHHATGGVEFQVENNGDVTMGEVLQLKPRASAPACVSGDEGSLYVDSDTRELCFCDGTSWTGLKAGGACV